MAGVDTVSTAETVVIQAATDETGRPVTVEVLIGSCPRKGRWGAWEGARGDPEEGTSGGSHRLETTIGRIGGHQIGSVLDLHTTSMHRTRRAARGSITASDHGRTTTKGRITRRQAFRSSKRSR